MLPLIEYLVILLSNPKPQAPGTPSVQIAQRSFSLENRYDNKFVNDVFKDNILLTLKYLDGSVKDKKDISWENVGKPMRYEFTLKPGQAFAFHDQLLPEYARNVVKTTNAHFNSTDGFKSDGYLVGDGVCHLASLIYWAAKDAGLTTVSLASHNFAKINDVPKEYGVSIRFQPGAKENSARQNLYIVNNFDKPVTFVFDYDGANLDVKVKLER
ncbi:MAG: hypothetical protein A2700_01275 [Candidatus Blackburnbacteria bacterium RIFCSPHIGHO2_01_FULL_44_64]|uniref:Uncharacterized protein n=1 Tax=Candidatus Blackburnbacteria bacterium RIFCSPHIGHO2_02_FULL_44_20 TaxID=1797516 RepID=A0A1G1V6N4_9BACT|nr:MAG: hypothetical protein A2700_01275 [Candidatus Blackburnbacteria bacterium RIFCSPHIGHO2_01_FULL_44_64]OGY10715.1 MAG: hypothetical protein A3E16_01810 [Candidatus Blackburnbacteria bacterium RIFCSPHIGHO2_12_FULL_44_25]OGY11017.1 MAG: hypothetical protein A3D26_03820 [Candidatus Blackburnbacteria bacterium RIFCSPHIGHO2_02_FULL_44_20]OGY15211.1 MAG: hypothetical protein A3A62_02570 [Candidatus Blackburnbacteria bacterium RIFCSPLOWO2_01_FULL_44_43]OGY15847.1 MAG: hypothetical protein A3H88_0